MESDHAYERGGDVYFRVASFPGYGKLSNRPLEEMQQGEGDDAAELKESPQDFALWKARKEGEDTYWESPWGEGRPGWHIECSAMAEAVLGIPFEVHGGGSDLVFPHHENEIAQTEAARGKPLSPHLDAQRHGADGRREDGQVGGQHPAAARRARGVRARRVPDVDGRRALPQAGGLHRGGARGRDPRGGARARRGAAARCRTRPGSTTTSRRSSMPWPTTSTPRRPAPCCSNGWPRPTAASTRARRSGPAGCGEMLHALGLETLLEADDEAPEELQRLAAERDEARARATSSAPTRSATSSPSPAGRSATPRRAPAWCGGRDRLRTQPGARGAARQAAGAARVRDREGRAGGVARRDSRP